MRRALRNAALALGVALPAAMFGPLLPGLLAANSGIAGQTDAGTTCPSAVPGESCPSGHVAVTMVITYRGWPAVAAVYRTGPSGQFRITLAPGSYTVNLVGIPQWPRAAQTAIPVVVRAGQLTPLPILFISGIAAGTTAP